MARFIKGEISPVKAGWQIAIWMKDDANKPFCQSVHTFDNRREARQFRTKQRDKFSPSPFYDGAAI